MAAPGDPSTQTADYNALYDSIVKVDTATDIYKNTLTSLESFLKQHQVSIAAVAGATAALGAAQALYGNEAYKSIVGGMQNLAMVPRQLAAEIAGGNVLLMEQASADARVIQARAYEDQQRLKETVDLGFGGLSLPIASYYENAAEFGAAYRNTALSETRIFNAAMKALDSERGFEIEKFAAFAKDGLGVQTAAMTSLYQEEFSKTGAITGKAIEDFSAVMLAAQRVTGENVRQLSEDMQKMVNNVDMFGNATYSQMASLSSVIHQVGLDIEDVGKAAGKFMSFESATKAVSDLGAALGVSLDTMNLFYLANEDKEGFILSLRQQLIDQGIAFEDLSFQEQKYVAQAAGIGVRQAQSLFNSQIDVTQSNVAALIESTSKQAEFQGDELAAKLVQTGGFADKTLEALKPENLAKTLAQIKDLTGGTNALANESLRLSERFAEIAMKSLPAQVELGQATSKAFTVAMKGAMDAIKDLDQFIEKFVKNDGLIKIIEAIRKSTLNPESIPPAWRPIVQGAKLFSDGFIAEIDDTAAKTGVAAKKIDKSFNDNFGGAFENAAERVEKLRAGFKDKLAEIDKTVAEIGKEGGKVQTDIGALKSSFESFGGLSPEVRDAKLKAMYSGKEGFTLSPEEIAKVVKAMESGQQGSLMKLDIEIIKARTEAAVAKLEAEIAKPAAPAAPKAPAGSTPETPAAAAVGATSSKAPSEFTINLKLDLVKTELSSLIHAEVVSAISDVISGRIQVDNVNGTGSGGFVKIRVEQ